jgi:hypothetical protein
MRHLFAAAAAAALLVGAPALAQTYYDPPTYPAPGDAYPDDPNGPMDDYGQYDDGLAAPEDQDAIGPEDYGPQDQGGPDDGYSDPGADRGYGPAEQYGSAPDADDRGAPQYAPYESVRPAQRGPMMRAPQASDAAGYDAGIPADILRREDRLEQRIQRAGERGLVPSFHVDNLMVQLDSIRAQQEELAARDNGLNPTDRAFIESRLQRLEANVTW